MAHPELEGSYVQPFTMEERLGHARQAATQLGATIPWIVDPMDNRLKHALGDRANSEYIVDPKGMIVRKRAWSSPSEVRKDLEELVGKVERVTNPEDLKLNVLPPLSVPAAKGVLTRVPRSGMFPLISHPKIDATAEPFFAKLRCEADLTVIDDGQGKLYLGFHLDPFHGAHWNNLTKPLRYELEIPDGVLLSQASGIAPPVSAEDDVDPREFLVDVKSWPSDKTIRLTVMYAACTEESCHQVRQEYVLHRQRNKDAGRAAGAGFRVVDPEAMITLLLQGDKNGDGMLAEEELNSVQRPRFADFDLNKDGVLDKNEIRTMADQVTAGRE